jgi:hypothetical protein
MAAEVELAVSGLEPPQARRITEATLRPNETKRCFMAFLRNSSARLLRMFAP